VADEHSGANYARRPAGGDGSLDRGEAHAFGPSTAYDVLENGRRYAPKAVVGVAARRGLGRPLRPDEFWADRTPGHFVSCRTEALLLYGNQDPRGRSCRAKRQSVFGSKIPILRTINTADRVWEFGVCLWSSSAYAGGSDSYPPSICR
jgi:hypothetical protein